MDNKEIYIHSKMLNFSKIYNIEKYYLDFQDDVYTLETYPLFSENKEFVKDKFNMILEFFKSFDGSFISFVEDYTYFEKSENCKMFDLLKDI